MRFKVHKVSASIAAIGIMHSAMGNARILRAVLWAVPVWSMLTAGTQAQLQVMAQPLAIGQPLPVQTESVNPADTFTAAIAVADDPVMQVAAVAIDTATFGATTSIGTIAGTAEQIRVTSSETVIRPGRSNVSVVFDTQSGNPFVPVGSILSGGATISIMQWEFGGYNTGMYPIDLTQPSLVIPTSDNFEFFNSGGSLGTFNSGPNADVLPDALGSTMVLSAGAGNDITAFGINRATFEFTLQEYTPVTVTPGTTIATELFMPETVEFFCFELTDDVIGAQGDYLRIDTLGSSTQYGNDTEIGLYDASGNLLAENDDIDTANSVWESALAYGDDTGALVSSSGDLPAGTYYLAVGAFPTTFGPTNFDAINNYFVTGTIQVNFDLYQAPCIPEPSTMTLLALGGLVLLHRPNRRA